LRERGFTLLELLVVIAIIGVLVGILAPSLAWAMHAAKLTACKNNINSLVKANHVYAGANKQSFALAAEDLGSTDLKRWFGEREDMHSAFEPTKGSLSSYLPGLRVGSCPVFDGQANEAAGQGAAFEAGCGAYGYNDLYVGGSFGSYRSQSAMAKDNSHRGYTKSARPEDLDDDTVMFADTAYFRGGEMMAYSFTHAPRWAPGGWTSPNPTIHFRHRGQAVVGWADGHATAEEMTFSGSYKGTSKMSATEVKELDLGWFGEQHPMLPEANYLFDRD
jgi:prepilin-type N-terminal cleavage/methylation domain-containing protein/prepilin-type processing-associated H-X9-DG protein